VLGIGEFDSEPARWGRILRRKRLVFHIFPGGSGTVAHERRENGVVAWNNRGKWANLVKRYGGVRGNPASARGHSRSRSRYGRRWNERWKNRNLGNG